MADESRPPEAPPALQLLERRRAELHARIERDFSYHPPRGEGDVLLYQEIRDRIRAVAHFLVDVVPPGRELHQALTDLDNAVMHANAGYARGTAE